MDQSMIWTKLEYKYTVLLNKRLIIMACVYHVRIMKKRKGERGIMAGTVTMKSTKQEIMDAYLAALKELNDRESLKDDPIKEAKENKKKETIASAEQIVQESILNPEIIKRYNDLKDAVEMKQLELEDLYGIEAKANSLVAIINAYKDKVAELEASYKEKEDSLKESLQDTKDMLNEDIKELEIKKRNTLMSINEEAEELKATIATERSREEEEYNYNLTRSRKKKRIRVKMKRQEKKKFFLTVKQQY